MKIYTKHLSFLILTLMFGHLLYAQPESNTEVYKAPKAATAPVIDGNGNDAVWNDAAWVPISNVYIGNPVTADDFSGRYKIVWTSDRLYILAEITDDILRDVNSPALTNFWDDDCLELFLDENRSKGNHQFNYNAFAYHMAINNLDVADYGTDQQPHLYNDHITSAKTQSGTKYTWEVSVKVFGDNFVYGQNNTPLTLNEGKIMGFNLAYCDNDKAQTRENFIGSRYLDKSIANNGYITADVFAELQLVAGSIPTGIDASNTQEAFMIYPNPAEEGIIYLNQTSNIEIYNALGNLVSSAKAVSSVDISSYSKGSYLVKTDKGEVLRFVKK
ncbi:sugar-binding protein [Sporocytophaga myxococcoides]|uniref:sugar-binding protein n=1 Tax=Sporocytophaga myxococcoides TaxID=153721 RepID=UPI0009DBE5BC|nr:sugar-binding protein [Sporocytophaga myxococcoides]